MTLLRGVRYRAGRSAVVASLAAVAVAAAVLGPAFSRAAQQSVLTDALAAAPPAATGLHAGAAGTAAAAPAAHDGTEPARRAVDAALAGTPVLAAVLDQPIAGVDTDTVVTGGSEPIAARLAWRAGVCDQLRIAGDCPGAPGEVLVSDRTAAAFRIAVGDRLAIGDRAAVVVGTYTPTDPAGGYWGRTVYFVHGGFDPATGAPRGDAIFTGAESDVYADPAAAVTLGLDYPLRPGAVRLDDLPALRDQLRSLPGIAGLEVTSQLPAVLDDAAGEQAAIGRIAPVLAVPLFLLAVFVLAVLVAATVEERGPELALAKLRGFPAGRVARFGLGEVLLLIVAATPAGIGLGLAGVAVTGRVAFAAGTGVELRWPVWAAAAGALLGSALAATVAARTTLRREPLELLRRVPARGRWRAGLLDGLVLALAAAGLAVALTDRRSPVALLAPALVALAAGLLTARLVRGWARRRLRRPARRVPPVLAAAQLARRPAGQRVMAVLAVAVALLSFAAIGWQLAADARREHATDALGAETVYTVHADHPAALLAAVEAADPAGTAMAVVRSTGQYAGEPVELLAVDVPRLAGVVAWRDQPDLATLGGALRPREPAPLPVDGELAVTAEVRTLGPEPVRLTALVSAPGEPPRSVPLGTLAVGRHQYGAELPGCGAGCRLLGLGLGRTGTTGPFTATVKVVAIRSGDGDLPARFDDPATWQASPAVELTPGAGLTVAVDGGHSGDVLVEYQDTPPAVPVVLAGPVPAEPGSIEPESAESGSGGSREFEFPGFTEQPERFTVAAEADRLPRAGDRGLLFDLATAVSRAERTVALADTGGLRYEVWASPAAPADLPQRLADQGVPVLRTESMADTLAQLGRQAPALGFRLALLAAAVAVALAAGVAALYTRLGAAARGSDAAGLRTAGVPARWLRRAAGRELAVLLGGPVLAGLAAGGLSALLMLPGIPLVVAA